MTRARYLSNNRGFTLIEAFLASIVFAMGLFALLLAVYTEFAFVNQNRENAIATLSAQEEIENIRGMSFDTILGLGASFTSSGFIYLKNPVGILAVDSVYGATDMRRVSATVQWESLMGRTLQKSLATIVTRNGIDRQ